MVEIKIIGQKNVLGRDFIIYGSFEKPFFYAGDVAEWIDYSKTGARSWNTTKMLSKVGENEKMTVRALVKNQNRTVIMLTENGIYQVLENSRKPRAKKLKKQLAKQRKTEEVI